MKAYKCETPDESCDVVAQFLRLRALSKKFLLVLGDDVNVILDVA